MPREGPLLVTVLKHRFNKFFILKELVGTFDKEGPSQGNKHLFAEDFKKRAQISKQL